VLYEVFTSAEYDAEKDLSPQENLHTPLIMLREEEVGFSIVVFSLT
jgi:hypothetical protein